MRALIRRTTSVWEREEGFSVLLALLVGNLFVAPLLKEGFPVLAAASTALSILLFVVGALVVSRSAWAALAVSVLAGSAIALEMARQIDGSDPFAVWRVGAACLTIGLFAAVTLARVFSPGPVTSHRLTGAVVAYLLVGLTWAYAYEFLEAVRHGAFHAAESVAEGSYPTFLYYSFVTLTTVGYGDITPISSAARALSNLESLVGVLYPAVLIGRLLSKQVSGDALQPPPPG
jgi:hypothetical protein